MKIITDEKRIKELLSRGVERIIDEKSLLAKLKSGKQLIIKHGIDPTGSKFHIGRAISLWKLKEFQELGHKIVLITGSFTAQIGDASDKQAMRKPLTVQEIKENMKNYEKQLGQILDLKKTEFNYNNTWFDKMNVKELLKLTMGFTAQQMIQRKNFKERWEQQKPIGVHEILYPIFQGYDSFIIKADLEIGGNDQLFNLVVGREIQKMLGQKPQDIMIFEMLLGLDGRKMSTSWGNVINTTDSADDQYGKIMSMKDDLIFDYMRLATKIPLDEIENYKKQIREKRLNHKIAKEKLAFELVKMYHGENLAQKAQKNFSTIFKEKKLPEKIETKKISGKKMPAVELLFKSGLVNSKSEARRIIGQNGMKIDGKISNDWKKEIDIRNEILIQVGKRKFLRIKGN